MLLGSHIHVCAFQMNGLGDDICDILMESIFRTRLAQVYLAGNGITKVRHLNRLFVCFPGAAAAYAKQWTSRSRRQSHTTTTFSGRGEQSQVPCDSMAPTRRHATVSAADTPGHIFGYQAWPSVAGRCRCPCGSGCRRPILAAAAEVKHCTCNACAGRVENV